MNWCRRIHNSGKDSKALQNEIDITFNWEGRTTLENKANEQHLKICISLKEPRLSHACGSFTTAQS